MTRTYRSQGSDRPARLLRLAARREAEARAACFTADDIGALEKLENVGALRFAPQYLAKAYLWETQCM